MSPGNEGLDSFTEFATDGHVFQFLFALTGLRRIAMCDLCRRRFSAGAYTPYTSFRAFFTYVLPLNRQRQIEPTQSIH